MSFGATYEITIVLFIVVFGLLYIVGGYENLSGPFIEIVAALGLFILILGWGRKDYDLFFSGIVFLVLCLALLFTVSQPVRTGLLNNSLITLMLSPFIMLYTAHPILLVLFLLFAAYFISRVM